MSETKKVNVLSEIDPLKRVITHRPDSGIARISPKRAEELLFDDIVYLPQMQEEHDIFTNVLKTFLGAENVLETEQLILEGLENDPISKQELIDMIAMDEEIPTKYKTMLEGMPNKILASTLITGYYETEDIILFDPIPNFIFTRDIAVIVQDHVVITKAAKAARFRENFLTRFIFYANPIFKGLKEENRIINLNHIDDFPPSKKGETVSIEGGDMMIIANDYLLIGCSERTSKHAILSLRDELFKRGVIKNVVQVNIPSDRSCMHIDTIFTMISDKHVVAFKPIVLDGLSSNVIVHTNNGIAREYPSVKDFFLKEINPDIEFILSGDGESPYQEREQWTDGCNLVAIRSGIAITYDRNPYTEVSFKKHGYSILHAKDFLEKVAKGELDASTMKNTIITLPSSELSRARGGSHCMTCPIERG